MLIGVGVDKNDIVIRHHVDAARFDDTRLMTSLPHFAFTLFWRVAARPTAVLRRREAYKPCSPAAKRK